MIIQNEILASSDSGCYPHSYRYLVAQHYSFLFCVCFFLYIGVDIMASCQIYSPPFSVSPNHFLIFVFIGD